MLSVAMATYNGGQFIEEQINSIINQSLPPDEIIICDDGSTDNTVDIIHEIIEKYPGKIKLFINKNGLGPAMNFEKAIQLCQGDYIALSDQDDVWKKDKLELSLKKLIEIETKYHDIPILIHTDLEVVNQALETSSKSFWQLSGINPGILRKYSFAGVYNGITGCTTIFNQKTKQYIFPFPKNIIMHDSWIGLCVAKYGKIDYIEQTTILYRQHSGNAVGAKFAKKSISIWIKNLRKNVGFNQRYYQMVKQSGYGSPLKFIFFKFLYSLIKPR